MKFPEVLELLISGNKIVERATKENQEACKRVLERLQSKEFEYVWLEKKHSKNGAN